MATRCFAAAVCCMSVLWLAGCVYSGSPMCEPQGFSSSYFRYQMQAQQQAQRQRTVAAQQQSVVYCDDCEEPSWWDRFRSHY